MTRFLLAALAVLGLSLPALAQDNLAQLRPAPTPITDAPRAPGAPFLPGGAADRITLAPGADASRAMAVSFRTHADQTETRAEIGRVLDGPTSAADVRALTGESRIVADADGAARYHHVRFDDLEPATRYVYRVRGLEGWSPWLPFVTASDAFAPTRLIYLGDAQNRIGDVATRVIAEALTRPHDMVLHAGDLVASRLEIAHDDEWAQWHAAGGLNYAMRPQVPAAGNHEFVKIDLEDGSETRVLTPHFPALFPVPANGADGLPDTTFVTDYQGVRIITLDTTSAVELGGLETQTRWLEEVLTDNPARWTIALFHHPVITCARPENTEFLMEHWTPLFEAHGVDLVLQGHDHCYARYSEWRLPAGPEREAAQQALAGPVYLVSVSGYKMYALNDRAAHESDRYGADTQTFQLIDISHDRLVFETWTPTGGLYDAFALERREDGRNRLVEDPRERSPLRVCYGDTGPDGGPCHGSEK
ncbi:metallophosphoesterase family protein [Alkalicaulis satelles]|uniref:Metallophosphoesterase family protein n=1 Tax=Alkalicaulis satelles TaxID=2609175 RepID=A0A5M6ZJX3_9PROT|nr:metallophosphoesterase family protein [Alkalicaulis satelles]KAA5805132.1 metallophosphoesterase family protein [Alkalicaulis satelles]